MCTRLATILPEIISRNQGAFIQGRSILENILICQDLVRMCNKGNCSPRCMFKMDLQKAYDSIKWNFIDHMMVALQFPERFRKLIMLCVTTPTFSLNLNGATFGFFPGVSEIVKQDILQVSRFTEGMLPFKYLGISIQAGILTRQNRNILVEKVIARARGIGERKLSYVGRLTLINSVLNTLHNYWSSIFIIPKIVIKRIVAVCRNYLWDGGPEYHRAPLVAWDEVCCSKKSGGLGVKNAELWNIATVGNPYTTNYMLSRV
ncbi:uncharacterized protein LOC141628609 [Silene latifolia]|uniref:uncharacterized protein LOC141628609 n=1 Tax=Silene latifolia TaxID=37657 RepID=UPI003D773FAD